MNGPVLKGIIPPLITPLQPRLNLDIPSLKGLIEHVIGGGVQGIFLLGSTGEGPSLHFETKRELVREGLKAVSGRVPVLVNISSASFQETMQMAALAAREGANYVVLSPPFYFEMNVPELHKYYSLVAESSSLPLVIYNAPGYTKSDVKPQLAGKLMMHRNIVGIKDSSGSMEYIDELLHIRNNKPFPILVGPEMLLGESLLKGCNGGVCGGANLYPALYVNYYRSAVEKNKDAMDRIQHAFHKIQTDLYEVADSPMGIVIGLKYLLAQRGLCSPQMALPVYTLLSSEQKLKLDTLDKDMILL